MTKAKIGIPEGMHFDTWSKWRGKTGIYCIQNKVNKKVYVGSAAVCLMSRVVSHRGALRKNKHKNKHLQASWNKYGESVFTVRVLQFCLSGKCIEHEQVWIDKFKASDRRSGYNRMPKAGSVLGMKHGDGTKS